MRQPTSQDKAFAWYLAALKHGAGSPQAPIHADEPQCGYYRLKNGADYLPAYIGLEGPTDPETGELTGDESMVLKVKYPGNPLALDRPADQAWTYVAGHPVGYEAFKVAWETGKWPDAAPGANFQASDSLEGLVDQLDGMLEHVPSFKHIKTQTECDQAANLKDRLMDCHKALEAMRKAEKEPLDKAAAAVQAKFLPHMSKARDAVDALRIAMKPYLEAAERAAKAAAVAAAGAGAAAQVEVKARAGGMSGKRTSTRTSKVAVIVDYDAALAAVKARDEVRAVVQKVCNALIKAGATVPGVEAKEETSVV